MRNKLPSQFATDLRKQLLQAAKAQGPRGFASPSNTKFEEIQAWLTEQFELDHDDIAIYWAGDQKNVPGRGRQAQAAARKQGHPFAVTVVVSPQTDSCVAHAIERGFAALVTLIVQAPPNPEKTSEIAIVAIVGADPDARPFIEAIPKAEHRELTKTLVSNSEVEPSEVKPMQNSDVKLVLEPRVERMVKTSMISTSAIILVGPPGTGKSTLLRQVIEDVRRDPRAFGFKNAPKEPKWVTAEDGWTTRELVGGETVDEGQRLRFALGHVLDAIRENRWLVVDEINRADMDKIFGALMTWLSQTDDGEVVDVGRASTDPHAPAVQLGWGSTADCVTEGVSRLTEDLVGKDPIRFLAGKDWRLLGTYNAVDTHRVFRFGQALGRRFVRVPIPAPTPALFEKILQGRKVDESISSPLVALYAAHHAETATCLGPAFFLQTERYVAAALPLGTPLAEAIAEGYLVTTGSWLATLDDDDLTDLGARVRASKALPAKEWDWICSMIPSLR